MTRILKGLGTWNIISSWIIKITSHAFSLPAHFYVPTLPYKVRTACAAQRGTWSSCPAEGPVLSFFSHPLCHAPPILVHALGAWDPRIPCPQWLWSCFCEHLFWSALFTQPVRIPLSRRSKGSIMQVGWCLECLFTWMYVVWEEERGGPKVWSLHLNSCLQPYICWQWASFTVKPRSKCCVLCLQFPYFYSLKTHSCHAFIPTTEIIQIIFNDIHVVKWFVFHPQLSWSLRGS